ncbi:uncharacterized mitochondrial protein AtMg00810-like [Juglans microcarpa x Juglans regia]|uniref:uncharacterized mitochondrial protein AtMg00810-like n=1 Tax=Juglans microcarpa x Juglans regia TaxID=2249226 RepID=UPI001B7F2C7D|nr:uncharacterized mitochondrial protein AtMg00810-like [Juglans microcarpa x Juglans regia]
MCCLHKALYGLKLAPRASYTRLSQWLLDLGFVASQVDTSLFTFHGDKVHLYILIYVDDLLVTDTHDSFIFSLITKLMTEFSLKDLGALGYFLGIQATRDAHGLHLCQSKNILDILHRARMVGAKPYSAPCLSGAKLSANTSDHDPLSDAIEYRKIVSALQYCTLSRLDIASTVNQLCQYLHAPTSAHWASANQVLRYLKGTVDHGLYYTHNGLNLQTYSDSDWADDLDDRRSTTRYGVFLGSSLISWSAKKQPMVSQSSTKAEYHALDFAVAELYPLCMILRDLHIPLHSSPIIWCDNINALALDSNLILYFMHG